MSPFRRKRDGDGESSQDTVEDVGAAPAVDEPDPAAWALPADAGAVTTDAGTAATDAAAAETVEVVEAEEPAAVAADPEPEPKPEPVVAAPVDPTPAPEPRAAWTPPPAASSSSSSDPAEKFAEVSEQRPELLVAGAFAGAFLFARILKRITNDD